MSRSQPNAHAPNPATRWFEWQGEDGIIRYYSKNDEKNITVPLPFEFLLLDQLSTVKGWHDQSKSVIYANEVRDTRQDVLTVRAFKGGELADGLYRDIRDLVKSVGGQFVANCYIAYKADDGALALGSVQFKGAALGAWMEFTKGQRSALYHQAIRIDGYNEDKKGRIVFRTPTFALNEVSPETQEIALDLDKALQTYLEAYLRRTTRQVGPAESEDARVMGTEPDDASPAVDYDGPAPPIDDSEIPF